MDLSTLPLVIMVAEQKQQLISFATTFDPHRAITEGQLSFIQMEIKWNGRSDSLTIDKKSKLSSGEWLYLTSAEFSDNIFLYCIVTTEESHLTEQLCTAVSAISDRGALYTAEELYEEILDAQMATSDPMKLVSYSPSEALGRLKEIAVSQSNLESIALLLQLLSDYNQVHDPIVYQKTMELLDSTRTEDPNKDEYLDAANVIADRLYHLKQLSEAQKIYDKLTGLSDGSDRNALNLNCRLRSAQIAKDLGQGPDAILDRIGNIDDGSLNLVSHSSQVLFFTLQGAAYDSYGELSKASGFHEMAIAISKTEIIPSIYFAESYGFMGKLDASKLRPDLATSKFLTASNIAMNHDEQSIANYYADQAAKQELIWADILRSTAIHYYIVGKTTDATYSIWQAIRKVVDSYIHGSRGFHRDSNGVGISKTILQDGVTLVKELEIEFGEETLNTVEQQLGLVQSNQIPPEQQEELLKFLTSRISNMIPVPPPIIMIIGLDGRLLLGGQISKQETTWNQGSEDMNVLFSGALTAIMAMLSEVISEDNPLRMLDVGQTQIMIEKGEACIGTVLVDRELVILRKALKETLTFIDLEYPELKDYGRDAYTVDLYEAVPVIEQIFIDALNTF